MDMSINLPQLSMVGNHSGPIAREDIFRFQSPRDHRIVLLLSGDGSGDVGPLRIPAQRAIGWFLPAGETETLELHGDAELWWLTFEWPQFYVTPVHERALQFKCLDKTRQTQRIKYVDGGDASRMVEHFKTLQRCAERYELAGELTVRSLLLLLIAFYMDIPEEISRSSGHRALQQFREMLDARAFEDVTIRQLAAECNMSPEYLRRMFLERFGVQPNAYRTALRMARARQLLTGVGVSVKEVAYKVGYHDPFYFSRVFKSHYRLNPSEMIYTFRS